MTPLILLLAAGQAGLLLWSAVLLSNTFMRPRRTGPFFWALGALALPLALAKYTANQDQHRVLCSTGDCLILVLSVACVRVIAMSKEEDRLALELEEDLRRAAAAQTARLAREAEELKASEVALAARIANAEKKAAVPMQPPRHLTPSLLRDGAPSPRLPTSPRK